MSCGERFALLCLCSHARLPHQSLLSCCQPARFVSSLTPLSLLPTHPHTVSTPPSSPHILTLPPPLSGSLVRLLATPTLLHLYIHGIFSFPTFSHTHTCTHSFLVHTLYMCAYTLYQCAYVTVSEKMWHSMQNIMNFQLAVPRGQHEPTL